MLHQIQTHRRPTYRPTPVTVAPPTWIERIEAIEPAMLNAIGRWMDRHPVAATTLGTVSCVVTAAITTVAVVASCA